MADPWSEWLLHRRHGGDPQYEREIRGQLEAIRARVLDGAMLSAGMTLVDIGAGDGLIAFGALERVGTSLRVILTDLSAPLLEHAEALAKEQGLLDSCTFVLAAADRLDGIADASSDAVTCRAVLAYVADKRRAASEFYRVLRPGGRLSLAEPIARDGALQLAALATKLAHSPVDAFTTAERLVVRWKTLQLPSTVAEIERDPFTSYSEQDLVEMFQQAGFDDIHLELHIDVRKAPALSWDTFLDTAPRPRVQTLREILALHFSEAERDHFEAHVRPSIESGGSIDRGSMAYLTAVKPWRQ